MIHKKEEKKETKKTKLITLGFSHITVNPLFTV